jgi:hypothetical protein
MPFSWSLAAGIFSVSASALLLGGVVTACGTDAEGIDSCRKLENARCERAPGCNIPLAVPPHEGAPDTDVAACKRYYNDACLHGLVSEKDPGEVEIEACRVAIQNGTCDVVTTPSIDPACAFLDESPPVTDAGSDADADAESDASLAEQLGDASPF